MNEASEGNTPNKSFSNSKEKNGETIISESEECLIFQDLGLFSEGFPVMEEIRRQGKLCDVTLKVDDQSFSGHRIVLAATIPYFQAMFTHDMMESKQKEITMHGIDAISLEALINYAYSGRITINANNVQSLIMGASFLQLNKVRDACGDFIKKRFTPHNVIGIRQFAESLGCTSVVESADKYLQQYFVQVTGSEEYLMMSCNELLDIIKRDELYVLSEEQVFEAVIKWVKKDPEIRQLDLPLLLSKVRMPLLPPHFLADRIATEDLIRKNHDCSYLLGRFWDDSLHYDEKLNARTGEEKIPMLRALKEILSMNLDDVVVRLQADLLNPRLSMFTEKQFKLTKFQIENDDGLKSVKPVSVKMTV